MAEFSWSDLLSSAVKAFVPGLAQAGVATLADRMFPARPAQIVQAPTTVVPAPAPQVLPQREYVTPPAPRMVDVRTPEQVRSEQSRLTAEEARLSGLSSARADLEQARSGTMTPDQSAALQDIVRQVRASQAARGMLETGAGAGAEADQARKYREGLIGSAYDRLNQLSGGYVSPTPMVAQAPQLAPERQVVQPPSPNVRGGESTLVPGPPNPYAKLTASMAPAVGSFVGGLLGNETPEQKRKRELEELMKKSQAPEQDYRFYRF